jgi:hypothetical protein
VAYFSVSVRDVPSAVNRWANSPIYRVNLGLFCRRPRTVRPRLARRLERTPKGLTLSDSDFTPLTGSSLVRRHPLAGLDIDRGVASPAAGLSAVAAFSDDLRLAIVRDVLQSIPAPAICCDEGGRIVFLNADARSLPGLRDAVGRLAEVVLPQELRTVLRAGEDGIYHWVDIGEGCYYAVCRAMAGGLGGHLLLLIPQGSPWHAMPHDPQ